MKTFKLCKDADFALLKHLLDDLVPLIFFFYLTVIRGGNYHLCKNSMIRLAFMFLTQKRHHYDKSTISVISDLIHCETVIPDWKERFKSHLNIFTEKKVEVFHSMLRMHCSSWSTADQIEETAKVLSARKFDSDFMENFLKPFLKKPHRFNVSYLSGKAAEFLVEKIIRQIYLHSGGPYRREKRRNKTIISAPVFGPVFDERSFPIGFSTQTPPSVEFICDKTNCTVASPAAEAAVLSCGHSFHLECIRERNCLFCEPFLLTSVKKLAEKFNQNLSSEVGGSDGAQESRDDEGEGNYDEEDGQQDEIEFYTSHELSSQLSANLATFIPAGVKPKYVNQAQKSR